MGLLKDNARWVVWLAVGVLVAFWPVLGADLGLYYGDHMLVFRQRWFWIVEALSSGVLPARTVGSAAGVPMESMLNGTYTPMTGLFFLAPFDVAYDWFVAGHVLLLAVGAYGFARALGAAPLPAVAAASVALFGPVVSFECLLVGLQGLSWAPWVWWAVVRVLRRPGPGAVAGLGLAGGFHLQAIMPETALLDLLVGVAILALARRRGGLERPGAAALGLLAGLLLAFGVAAVELFPVLEGLQGTRRGTGFDLAEQTRWSLRPIRGFDFFAPALSSLASTPFAEPTGPRGETRVYLTSLYLGFAPVLGLIPLFDRKSRGPALWLWGLALFGGLLALGDLTLVHGWVGQLPVLRNGRYPEKFLLLSAAAFAGLVPLGCARVAKHAQVVLLASAAHLGVAVALWSTLRIEEVRSLVTARVTLNALLGGLSNAAKLELVLADVDAKARFGLIASGVAFILVLGALVSKRQAWLPAVTTAILWLGLGLGVQQMIIASPTTPRVLPELEAALEGGSRYYMVSPTHRHPEERPDPKENLQAQYLRWHRLRGALVLPEGRRWYDYDPDGQSQSVSTQAFEVLGKTRGPPADRLLGRMGIRFLSIWLDLDKPGKVAMPIDDQPPQYLYPLDPVRPPISVHPRWARLGAEVAPGGPMWSYMLDARNFDAVVVDGPGAPAPAATSSTALAACAAAARVEGPKDTTGDRFDIRVEAPCPVMLLVLESWAPQWEARVDGTAAPVLKGDIGALAVAVPAGRHAVTLEFVGRTRRWAPVSAASGAVALVLAGLGFARRRKKTRPAGTESAEHH